MGLNDLQWLASLSDEERACVESLVARETNDLRAQNIRILWMARFSRGVASALPVVALLLASVDAHHSGGEWIVVGSASLVASAGCYVAAGWYMGVGLWGNQ